MIIYRVKDYQDMSRKAANIIAAQVILKPNCVLGLATGSTPEATYNRLVEMHKNGDLDFSLTKSVNLDEYKGIGSDSDQSYYYFMHKHLFDHVNIKEENTYLPNGLEIDSEKECARYDAVIRNVGGIDLQLLGIGGNAHIGFNEPSDAFQKGTGCVSLTESTIEANARFFENKELVPRFAYSMGIQSIMSAKKILLIASGEGKAEAIYNTIYGPITPSVPASVLQLHRNAIIVADEAALSKCPK